MCWAKEHQDILSTIVEISISGSWVVPAWSQFTVFPGTKYCVRVI